MSSCLKTFGVVGAWMNNVLNFVEPCLRFKVAELGFSFLSMIIGLVDIITDWINLNIWKKNPELLQYEYYTRLLYYITVSGTMLLCLQAILLCLKLYYLCVPDNEVQPFNENDSEQLYVPRKCKGRVNILWDISNILVGTQEDLSVMVFTYNIGTGTECDFAQVQLRSPTMTAAIAASMVNALWMLGITTWKIAWIYGYSPSHHIPNHLNRENVFNKCFISFLLVFVFVGVFLATPFIIGSTFLMAVNTIVLLSVLFFHAFHSASFERYPRVTATGLGVTSCIVCCVVVILGSISLKRLADPTGQNSLPTATGKIKCVLPEPKL